MIRQPPVKVPSAIAVADAITTQAGTWKCVAEMLAVGDERERDHAHRLLRVVRAVGEGEQTAGGELPRRKPRLVGPGRSRPTIR